MGVMKQTIHGIVVFYKNCNENAALVGIVSDESVYVKGYIQLIKDNQDNVVVALGQQVVVHAVGNKFVLDSAENYVPVLFWQDIQKLTSLMRVMHSIAKLPENMHFENLYENFLQVLAKLSVGVADYQTLIDEWEGYVFSLL